MFQSQRNRKFAFLSWIAACTRSFRGWLVLLGLAVGLWYLPAWVIGLLDRGPQSTDGLTLAMCFVGLSFYFFWRQRKQIAHLEASEEDRLLGYLLLIAGIVLFPFCRFSLWSQSLLWGLILSGIACCLWGGQFFLRHRLLALSTLVTVYPRPTITARLLWEAVTPYEFLEQVMAQAGAAALRLIGWQEATAMGSLLTFPEGAVDVYWGCNGFDMALTMALAGLVMGLFLKQSRLRILGFVAVGVVSALLFNVPRVMLLAVASVYWGPGWFDFWHGPWGGQLFSGVLFTVYYYVVMGLAKQRALV